MARLIPTGLTGHATEPADQVRASLASFGCLLGVFLSCGVALWSQLTVGWQWSKPGLGAIVVAMVLMSCAMLLLGSLAVLAAIPIAWCAVTRFVSRERKGLILPSLIALGGTAVLVIGGRHSGTAGPALAATPGHTRGWYPAAWPPSCGRRRSGSRLTGLIQVVWPCFPPPSWRGWRSVPSP